jgi:hypothetical protein
MVRLWYYVATMLQTRNTYTQINWEECRRLPKQSRWSKLHASMYPDGEIALTRFTHEELGAPDAYTLLYDRKLKIIGLRPANTIAASRAFPARRKGRHGSRRIRAWRLLRQYNIDLTSTVTFPRCEIDHTGTLILDLNDTEPPRTGRKKRVAV